MRARAVVSALPIRGHRRWRVSAGGPPVAASVGRVGFGRAGWYTYDLLDTFWRPSATRIILELRQLRVGDLIPIYQAEGPGGSWADRQGRRTRAVGAVVG